MKYILLLFLTAVFLACNTPKYIYSPASANLLQPQHKGALQVAANYATVSSASLGEDGKQTSNGLDLQSAYAINQKIAVKADYYFKNEQNNHTKGLFPDRTISAIYYKKKGTEFSGGYYHLGTEKKIYYQAFAGIGFGKFSFVEQHRGLDNYDYRHATNYFKGFLQPAIVLKKSENFSLIFSGRLSLLKYYRVKTDIPEIDYEAYGHIDEKPSFFGDLILGLNVGLPGLKGVLLQAQAGHTSLFTKFQTAAVASDPQKYDFNNTWLAIGIIADLFRSLKK